MKTNNFSAIAAVLGILSTFYCSGSVSASPSLSPYINSIEAANRKVYTGSAHVKTAITSQKKGNFYYSETQKNAIRKNLPAIYQGHMGSSFAGLIIREDYLELWLHPLQGKPTNRIYHYTLSFDKSTAILEFGDSKLSITLMGNEKTVAAGLHGENDRIYFSRLCDLDNDFH